MNLFKAIVVGYFLTVVFAYILENVLGVDGETVDVLAILIMVAASLGTYLFLAGAKNVLADAANRVAETKEEISAKLEESDGDHYVIAEREVEEGRMDPAVWSQALVKAKGRESLRKVEYMKLRAKQLKKSAGY